MANQLPDNQEDREAYLHDHRAGRFIAAVETTRQEADTVIMTVKAFAGEPDVLYIALNYAYHSGVAVTMAPDPKQSSSRQAGRPGQPHRPAT
jgi:hypothetical protein